MNIDELCERITNRFDYPIEVETILEAYGDVKIDAPSVDNRRRVDDLLNHLDGVTFSTPRDLSELVHGHLTDEYVGRKYYDDRGPNRAIRTNEPIDAQNQSI